MHMLTCKKNMKKKYVKTNLEIVGIYVFFGEGYNKIKLFFSFNLYTYIFLNLDSHDFNSD